MQNSRDARARQRCTVATDGRTATELGRDADHSATVRRRSERSLRALIFPGRHIGEFGSERAQGRELPGNKLTRAAVADQRAGLIVERRAAGMQVHAVVRQRQQHALDIVREHLRRTAIGIAGKGPVEIAVVDR